MCRCLRTTALAVLLAVCASAAGGGDAKKKQDKEALAKALKRLQGTWEQVSVESNGQKTGFTRGMEPHLTIRGDGYTVETGGKVIEKGTLKLDPVTKPGLIDLVAAEGAAKVKTYPGIYEVSENELRTCIARADVNRPTDFTAQSGSGRALALYRRVRPPK